MAAGTLIGTFRRIPYPRTVATVLGVWFLYLALGDFVAPRVIERAIPDFASEHLQRKASVGAVRVNPLLFRVLLRDFALAEQDGTLIVGFRRLLVDFELSSIARWAWTFSSIRLDGLDLRVDLRPDGTLNLAALADAAGGDGKEGRADAAPPRLLLQHALLRGGAVTFTYRTGSAPASATVQPLDLELRDISTRPDPRGPYTVSASLRDGGIFSWRGEVGLHPIRSQGELDGSRLKLATAWRFLRDRVDLAEPAGTIDFSAPQFSYGHPIWQAIATVLRNIVTAPFRALAGLFGAGAENLENIAFDPGRDVAIAIAGKLGRAPAPGGAHAKLSFDVARQKPHASRPSVIGQRV